MKRFAVAGAALALVAAACGGDSADPVAATTTTTAPAPTTTGRTFTGNGSDPFCGRAEEFSEAGNDILGAVGNGLDSALNELNTFIDTDLDSIEDDAPPEIRDDILILGGGLRELATAFEEADGNLLTAAGDVQTIVSDPDFAAAGDNVDTYLRDVCGLERGATDIGEIDTEVMVDLLDSIPPEQLQTLLENFSDLFGGQNAEQLAANPEALAAFLAALQQGDSLDLDDLLSGIDDLGGVNDGRNAFGDDSGLDALWTACDEGDYAACDELYLTSPYGSEYETFGDSCGNRNEPAGSCRNLYGS